MKEWQTVTLCGRWKQFPYGTSSHCIPDLACLSFLSCQSLQITVFFCFCVCHILLYYVTLWFKTKSTFYLWKDSSISLTKTTLYLHYPLISINVLWASTCLSVQHQLHKTSLALIFQSYNDFQRQWHPATPWLANILYCERNPVVFVLQAIRGCVHLSASFKKLGQGLHTV